MLSTSRHALVGLLRAGASSSAAAVPLPLLCGARRHLSFKEKQKRKTPGPKPFAPEEYERQSAIVSDLRAKCDAVIAEITPLQRREADLRKEEYDLWMQVRAIKRSFLEGTEVRRRDYLQWELEQRKQRDEDETMGRRPKHKFQVLYW